MNKALIVVVILVLGFGLYFVSSSVTGNSIADFFKKYSGNDECSDHIDNSGNGYCDYATKEGYCEDGSILGDPNCERDGAETAKCKPKEEKCDGVDNDCDGLIDEDLIETRACGKDKGICKQGTETRTCSDGKMGAWSNCEGAVFPVREICDGLDNNCNGKVDEECK